MADDPLMGFKLPPKDPAAKDPLMGFKPPADNSEIAQPQSMPGILNRPEGQSVGGYIGQLFGQGAQGMGQIGQAATDYGRVAGNTVLGLDRTLADLHGFSPETLAAERAKTDEASQRIGTAGTIAANMTGSGPMLALGIGGKVAKLAEPYAAKIGLGTGRYASHLLGGAAEGGAIGGTSAAEKGEGIGTGTLLGTLFGIGGSALGGGGRGSGPVPQAADRATLEADNAAAKAAMQQPKFNARHMHNAYQAADAALTPSERASVTDGMRRANNRDLTEASLAGRVSADDINGFARNPFTAARSPGDDVLAAKIRDNLVGPSGVLAQAHPLTPHPVGYAKQTHDAFQKSEARLNDFDFWSNADVNTAPAEAAKRLKPGMLYDQAGRDAVQRVADMAPKNQTPIGAGPGAWQGIRDYITGAATDRTLGAGAGWLAGGLPGIATDLTAQGAVAASKGAIKGGRAANIQRAIDAAKVATTTGRPTLPNDMLPPALLRELWRKAMVTGGTNF